MSEFWQKVYRVLCFLNMDFLRGRTTEEDYDDIGEYDWEAIVKLLDQIAPMPARFGEALKFLADRGDHGGREGS